MTAFVFSVCIFVVVFACCVESSRHSEDQSTPVHQTHNYTEAMIVGGLFQNRGQCKLQIPDLKSTFDMMLQNIPSEFKKKLEKPIKKVLKALKKFRKSLEQILCEGSKATKGENKEKEGSGTDSMDKSQGKQNANKCRFCNRVFRSLRNLHAEIAKGGMSTTDVVGRMRGLCSKTRGTFNNSMECLKRLSNPTLMSDLVQSKNKFCNNFVSQNCS